MKIRENVYKGLRPMATADTELVSYDANEDGSLTVRKYNFPGCSDFPRAVLQSKPTYSARVELRLFSLWLMRWFNCFLNCGKIHTTFTILTILKCTNQ